MTQPEKKYTFWELFQKEIIYLSLFIIFLTFAFNFNKYASTHTGFELYNHFIWWLFDINVGWEIRLLGTLFVILLIPLSFVSFILLIISIITHGWFKKQF